MGFRDLADDPIHDPAYTNLLAGPASSGSPSSAALLDRLRRSTRAGGAEGRVPAT